MRRIVFCAAILMSTLSWAAVAGESQRSMFLELKFSPLTPLIDRPFESVEGGGPYRTIFGGGPMLLGELEFNYQFFQRAGSLAAGISIGYAEKYGHAHALETGEPVSQSTGIHLVPLKALLVYRLDYFSLHYNVPLVPYVKGGFVMMPWWVTNGAGIEVANDIRGEGMKYGASGTVGLSLVLDFLDQRLARDFDTGMGVNHTMIFAEYSMQEMGLFDPSAMTLDLSSRHWSFGLAFEF